MFFTHVVRQQKTTIKNKNVVCERGSGTVSSVQDSPDKRHVTYDQREVFFPDTLLSGKCHHMKANQTRSVGRLKPSKIKGFSSSISEFSFVSIWSK